VQACTEGAGGFHKNYSNMTKIYVSSREKEEVRWNEGWKKFFTEIKRTKSIKYSN
jgi:hypothetical protein